MTKAHVLTLVLGLVAACATTQAQPPKLLWTALDSKEPIYQETTKTTTVEMTVSGTTVKEKTQQICYCSWTSEGRKNNKYVVKYQVLRVKTKTETADKTSTFDSTAKEPARSQSDLILRRLIDSEFTLTINAETMQVESVTGADDFSKKFGFAQESQRLLVKDTIEVGIEHQANLLFAMVPNKGVIPKDKMWSQEMTLQMGPSGTYALRNHFTFVGATATDKLATIKLSTQLSYAPPKAEAKASGLFKVRDVSLTQKAGKGEFIFNPNKGRMERSWMEMTLQGTLRNEATNVEFSYSQRTECKMTDHNPLQAK